MLPAIVPLLAFACVSLCYMASVTILFEHILSAFEVHFIIIIMILLVIYTGFFRIVQRRAHGRWGVARGAAAVWAGIFVMIIGIALFGVYLAVVSGLM